jgi:hypothetical protein
MYGMECVKMSRVAIHKELVTLESRALKKICGVNDRSKSTCLLYALNITPIELYILKRKLFFILQLLQNKATSELIENGVHRSIDDTLELIGVKKEHLKLGSGRYKGIIRSLVVNKLTEIEKTEKEVKESKLVSSVSYLLSHRSRNNDDTLQYLLDPRRCGRG